MNVNVQNVVKRSKAKNVWNFHGEKYYLYFHSLIHFTSTLRMKVRRPK